MNKLRDIFDAIGRAAGSITMCVAGAFVWIVIGFAWAVACYYHMLVTPDVQRFFRAAGRDIAVLILFWVSGIWAGYFVLKAFEDGTLTQYAHYVRTF